jgi:hypothetical protein
MKQIFFSFVVDQLEKEYFDFKLLEELKDLKLIAG